MPDHGLLTDHERKASVFADNSGASGPSQHEQKHELAQHNVVVSAFFSRMRSVAESDMALRANPKYVGIASHIALT